jgi:hypothetical protein
MEGDRIAEATALLDQRIDWAYFLKCGHRHRVLPLIYASFKKHFADRVPAEVLEGLRTRYLANLTTSIIQSRALFRITSLLHDASIPVLAFKGPTLGALAYGNMALRQSGDLDLLVLRKDIHKVATLLHSLGCRPYLPLPPRREAYYHQHHHEHLFFDDELHVSLDIHWALMPPYYSFSMDTRELMERSTTVVLDGKAIPTLGPEDLLLFLCLHGAKHRWEHLSWICDIRELLNAKPDMDWEEVHRNAGHLGLQRMLALGLELSRTLLGMKQADAVLNSMPVDPALWRLAGEVRQKLFLEDRPVCGDSSPNPHDPEGRNRASNFPCPSLPKEPSCPPLPSAQLDTLGPAHLSSPPLLKRTSFPPFSKGGQGGFHSEFNWFFMRSMLHRGDRFWAALEPFAAPTYYEYLAVRFPSALFFLYYLLRPVRLMLKYTRKWLPVQET